MNADINLSTAMIVELCGDLMDQEDERKLVPKIGNKHSTMPKLLHLKTN